jgi:DNA-directed RNA polymerase II subunit RPB2
MSTKKTEGNNENVGGGKPEGYVYERDTWPVIDRCFEDQPNFLAHNQLDSFNDLIESTIPVLIKKDCPIVIESGWNPDTSTHQIRYEVDFTNVYMSHPQINEGSGTVRALHPHEARHRNLTYSANLYIDVTHRLYKDGKLIDQKTESKIQFKIPAMVKSKICYLEKTEAQSLISMGECPYDKGGYFIINGSEKVIISQERPVDNKILCFSQKTGAKYDEIVEIRSTIDQRFYPVKNNIICLTRTKDGEIEQYLRFGCPYLTKEVSLIMIFKAIGITSEKEICEMICMMDVNTVPDDIAQLVTPSLEEMIDIDGTKRKIITQHDALVYISRHVNINMDYLVKKLGKNPTEQDKLLERNRYILDILRRDLLPHVGPDFRKKGLFLGYMAQRLIQVKLGSRLHDIRDHYANKRLDLLVRNSNSYSMVHLVV